jgi:copper chaperone NosL
MNNFGKERYMKKLGFYLLAAILSLGVTGVLQAMDQDVKQIPSCKYCGMNRETFAHSRMLIEYDDGTTVGTCSLHCSILDLALNLDKNPKSIKVGDFGTKELIDAEKAFWIIGGDKPGVMTRKAKWAFADKAAAEKYRQEHGGVLANFDESLEAAYQSLNEDTKMIREKRKMMRQKKMEKK